MTEEERAHEYARTFTGLGDRWRDCAPIDVDVQGDELRFGRSVVLRRVDGEWVVETGPQLRHLTVAQRETLDALTAYFAAKGFAPSVREMAAELGVSQSTVVYRLNRLRAGGWIARVSHRSRAIVLLTPPPAGAA